jgi:hypothetical protein
MQWPANTASFPGSQPRTCPSVLPFHLPHRGFRHRCAGRLLQRRLGQPRLLALGDEDEKIVAAWMIDEGYRLYDTLFAHHGVLNYALAHLTYLATGSLELAPYRLLNWGTVLLAGVAVAASPVLSGWRRRVVAGTLFCVLMALLSPLWYGHTLLYHSLGGVAVSSGLTLLLLPAMFGVDPGRTRALAGGAALAAAGFAAYPLAVPILILTLAALMLLRARGQLGRAWLDTALYATAGGLLFSIAMLAWLWRFGDIVGYGVYHIWFNQAVYTQFIDFDLGGVWRQFGRLFKSPLGWAVWFSLLFSFVPGYARGAHVGQATRAGSARG